MKNKDLPLLAHLEELRKRAFVSLIAVITMMAVSFLVLREWLMALLIRPFENVFSQSLVFISVSESFMAYLKISLLAGVVLASPVLIWQILAFLLPAFYKKEKRVLLITTLVATILFIGGVVFGYVFVLQSTLKVLIGGFGTHFQPVITVSYYLSFAIKFILPFGLAFELPLIIFLLARMGLITAKQLSKSRKYILLIILSMSAVLTPPDIFSQTLLAVPMYMLFELSIIMVKITENNHLRRSP